MRLPHDKVTDAYFNQAGTDFGEKVRRRINWICSQARGERILDVGCSQGITSILLGREGKSVLGIDYLQESIEFANNQLLNEPDEVQRLVSFERGNFLTKDFESELYDVILFTEVLEHLNQPEAFLSKGYNLLKDKGLMIITVPFGINDFFDHKKTYYLHDLLAIVEPFLEISKVEFMGKWIGLVGSKKGNSEDCNIDYPDLNSLVEKLELNFFEVERDYINKNRMYQIENEDIKKTVKQLELKLEETNKSVLQLKQENQMLTEKFEISLKANEEQEALKDNDDEKVICEKIDSLIVEQQKKEDIVKLSLVEEKEEKLQLKKELLELTKKNESLLTEHKDVLFKFNTLKKSKLGRMTLRYWKLRGRIHDGW